jgi:hypothetical protein
MMNPRSKVHYLVHMRIHRTDVLPDPVSGQRLAQYAHANETSSSFEDRNARDEANAACDTMQHLPIQIASTRSNHTDDPELRDRASVRFIFDSVIGTSFDGSLTDASLACDSRAQR